MHDLYLYALEKVSENWLQEANMYRNVCLLGLEGEKPQHIRGNSGYMHSSDMVAVCIVPLNAGKDTCNSKTS